ncbi:SpoIIE family protein phosphatase [Amycolatopsis thermophila]|uniref:histidine kinase n=1 Tax=Amycolatopsis thermophila TaxID=206084 RepID=A0ABU0EW06_9PSEU|nr:SpoIIE family protein phosphatase [Amycolatopsis thermophila]MDQ0379467.1 PAS domain S-box-containing protein [Amycolatopsis thermophila]
MDTLGEMGAMIAGRDWSASPLGPIGTWPDELHTALRLALSSRFPMLVWWGPELTSFYNDAYRPAMGEKHPRYLGRPASECWAEAWAELGPLARHVMAGRGATYSENQLLFLDRHNYLEETYWTFSYSPISSEAGDVLGILVAVQDTTVHVIRQRRLAVLSDLGEVSAAASVAHAARSAVAALSRHGADLPFALAYLFDDRKASLAASYGVGPGERAAPAVLERGGDPVWPLWDGETRVCSGLRSRFGPDFVQPVVVGTAAPDEAAVLPLVAAGRPEPAGALVLGVSAYQALDSDYRAFLELVARQVSSVVTDALAYESERRRSEALAELDRAKSEFFANVSHEFRTPLTLIAGPAEDALADTEEPLPPGQRERLELVHRNAGRLRRLVNDLLDFAKLEAGRLQPDAAPHDLAALTTEIAESFAPAVRRAGLRFDVDCPPLSRAVAVDPDMWEKIVLNLLSNGLKYTREGGVAIRLRERDERAELVVTDTGAGIAADELPKLFQRFHRARGRDGRSHEGAGIGLALVRELVRLHDGSVEVESVEGAGSTFTVRLPLASVPPPGTSGFTLSTAAVYRDEALQWRVDGVTEPEPAPENGPTLLVVEDNTDLSRFIARLLRPIGRVFTAADGVEGLELARRHRPDLVLSDVMMPRLDGIGLLRALRAEPATKSVPVLFLSARAGVEAAVSGLEAGADDYLPKPFSGVELLARVRANLALAALRRSESEFRRAMVESLREGVFVADSGGAIVEVNAAFTAITGYGADDLPMTWPYPWLGAGAAGVPVEGVAAHLGDGQEASLVIERPDGGQAWVALTVTRVEDSWLVGTLRDVTVEKKTADRESVLAAFAADLAAATDVSEVLHAGVAALRAILDATRVVAAIWPSVETEGLVAGDPATGSFDELDPRLYERLDVARTQRPGQIWSSSTGFELGATLGGDDSVVWAERENRPLGGEDRALFGMLVAQLAQALGRARSYDQARAVALTLQHAILGPTDLPSGFAVRYEPAVRPLEVGGDWYDVARLPDGRIAVVVGDCVGRGLAAASVMGQLRSACSALLLSYGDPARALDQLDGFARQIPGALCTTVFCAVVDPVAGLVTYSSAGHPSAVLSHADGTDELLDQALAVPLAVRRKRDRPRATVPLRPGSVLLLYTDGLVERHGQPIDEAIENARVTLREVASRRPGEITEHLLGKLLPAEGHNDDVAVLVYVHPPGPLRLELPAKPGSLVEMRRELRRWLAETNVDDDPAADVILAVDEACTNSIEHAYPDRDDGRLKLTATADDEGLEITITDDGSWRPPPADPGIRGRGRDLMRALMSEVDISPGETGSTVRLRRAWKS